MRAGDSLRKRPAVSGKRRVAEDRTPQEVRRDAGELEEEGFIVALTTAPDGRVARWMAQKVVEERLAACVNIVGPIKSVFRWKDGVEQVAEHLLVMKTTVDRTPALGERIEELHPYETPEFLSLSVVGGVRDYLEWIVNSVGPPEPPDRDASD